MTLPQLSVSPLDTGGLDVVLHDGSTLHVRPVSPGDVSAVLDLYMRLSPGSLHNRFAAAHKPTVDDAVRLCRPNGPDAFAIVAERNGRIVAATNYCVDVEAPDRAEVAFVVADELHGHGVGTRMLEHLATIAREHGIQTFDAYVLPSNHAMLQVFTDSGFEIERTLSRDVVQVVMSLAETRVFEQRSAARAQSAASASMRAFFEPHAVAVVGVSPQRGRIGSEIFHNLRATGFKGHVIPVNVHAAEIEGAPAYRRMTDIPEPIDLAVVAVPCANVEGVVDDCIAKGVRAIVVISAGFAETGPEGRIREAALLTKIRRAGVRMIGPNCMGLINTDPAFTLNATFAPVFPPTGKVAFSSQSGALGLAILEHIRRLNLGISTFVSVGNKADVSTNDLIQYWADDVRTDVILLYVESFGNPRKFSQLARRIGREKPIVAVKAGRSKAGARAACSHTGALAARDTIVDALFRESGVIRTDTLEELFDVAALLANQPVPAGARVAILTNAGGPAILAADACESSGLEVARLSRETIDRLKAFLPDAAGLSNPIDMLATATADDYGRAIPALLADPSVDSLLVIFIPPLVTNPLDVARVIVETTKGSFKPMLATFLGAKGAPEELSPVPCYAFPETAARALAHAVRYGRWRAQPMGKVVSFPDVRADQARAVVERALAAGGGWLSTPDVLAILDAVKIPTVSTITVSGEDEAVVAAKRIGYPVALKALGPELLHKTEAGAVLLNLGDETTLRRSYRDLSERLGQRASQIVMQPMIRGGIEMLVGATLDPTFGHVVLCGTGGTMVDLLADSACRLHPLTDTAVTPMLNEIRGIALVRGFRGAAPADEGALREVLLRLSTLIDVCPEIVEIDLNPVMVLPAGARVADARIRVGFEIARTGTRAVAY